MRALQGSQKLVLRSEIAGARSSELWRASQHLSHGRHKVMPALLPHAKKYWNNWPNYHHSGLAHGSLLRHGLPRLAGTKTGARDLGNISRCGFVLRVFSPPILFFCAIFQDLIEAYCLWFDNWNVCSQQISQQCASPLFRPTSFL